VCVVITTPGYRDREDRADRRLREAASSLSYTCPDHAFHKLSNLETPQGILAVVQQPTWNEGEVLAQPGVFGIFGDTIQDPLNVGAIIRTAAALGVSALWLTPDSADRFNHKVVRAAGGALLALPIFFAADPTRLIEAGCSIFSAEAGGRETVEMERIVSVPRRLILAVGSEGQGLSTKVCRQASRRFTIPMSRQIESLNVAATVAIATHYFMTLPKEA
jgi:TrmH family RNA methyltransferase